MELSTEESNFLALGMVEAALRKDKEANKGLIKLVGDPNRLRDMIRIAGKEFSRSQGNS